MILIRTIGKLSAQLCGVACVTWAVCQAASLPGAPTPPPRDQSLPEPDTFAFVTAGDMRNFVGPARGGKRYFDGVCEALQAVGAGAFMISPGDCDPPGPVRATLDRYLGTNYLWYPVIGNHELGKKTNVLWLRAWANAGIPHLTRRGPPGAEDTTYSFDFGNSHFIALDEYFDGKSDSVLHNELPDTAFAWLEKDLAATRKPLIWVIGHVPIKSLPDMDTGRERHEGGTLTRNPARLERFLQLLKQYHVRAYICGHTHDCSIARVNGVWQADSGHARGGGDTGAPSTFLKFRISGERAWVDVYRGDAKGVTYQLRKSVELN
jgi:Calcineurin-like phosphoesterase